MNEEDKNLSDKTEEPTPKRIEDAQKEGKFPFSRDLNYFAILAFFSILVSLILPQYSGSLTIDLSYYLRNAGQIPTSTGEEILAVGVHTIWVFIKFAFLPLFGVFIISIIAQLIQHGGMITFSAIKLDLNRISIIRGLKRIFSQENLIEFIKNIIKVIILVMIFSDIITHALHYYNNWYETSLISVLRSIDFYQRRVFIYAVIAIGVIGLADYIHQRYKYFQNLKMTRQEIREELKSTEGNPEVKLKVRAMRQERSKHRINAALTRADVVITNPTHYAVALEYKMDEMPAPKVVAKGVDDIALYIRKLAKEMKIEIVEDPPLARLLYSSTKIEQYIKPEHYKAVAKIIYQILRLQDL